MKWKDIKGYKGLYQLSEAGEVRSLDRISGGRKRHGKVLTIRKDGRVRLSRNGKEKTFKLSELQTNDPNNVPERTICLPNPSLPAPAQENISVGELLAKHTTERERLFQIYVPVMLTDIALSYIENFLSEVVLYRLPYQKDSRTIRQACKDYETDMRISLGVSLYNDLGYRAEELRQDIESDITRMLYCIDNAVMKAGPQLKNHLAISYAEVASVFIHLCWAYDEDFEQTMTERCGKVYKCGRNKHLISIDKAIREVVRKMCDVDNLEGTINLNDFPVLKDCVKLVRNRLNDLTFTFGK